MFFYNILFNKYILIKFNNYQFFYVLQHLLKISLPLGSFPNINKNGLLAVNSFVSECFSLKIYKTTLSSLLNAALIPF